MPDDARIPRQQQVFSITSAATSHSEEQSGRERRYAISMAIRTVCFVAGVFFVTRGGAWAVLGWSCFVGAVFLPYVAVILANAGVRRKGAGPSPFGKEPGLELDAPAPRSLDGE